MNTPRRVDLHIGTPKQASSWRLAPHSQPNPEPVKMSEARTEARSGPSTPAEPPVLAEHRGRVLLITLNRPDARNAVNLPLAQGLADALDLLDQDDALSVGVLTGAGKGFCAGMDLKAFASGERPWVADRGFAGIVQRGPVKPLIAAIEGFAVAGGLEIGLACDMIVAARGAKLGIPEVKRSLVAAGGALLRLPQRIPYYVAMELALTGEPIVAERAAELGLVNRLVAAGGAVEVAIGLAEELAANAPLALVASKRILQAQSDWSSAEAFERQRAISEPVFTSEDAREGAAAFAERRAPSWRGR
jgi:enoyl-CoA hydratase